MALKFTQLLIVLCFILTLFPPVCCKSKSLQLFNRVFTIIVTIICILTQILYYYTYILSIANSSALRLLHMLIIVCILSINIMVTAKVVTDQKSNNLVHILNLLLHEENENGITKNKIIIVSWGLISSARVLYKHVFIEETQKIAFFADYLFLRTEACFLTVFLIIWRVKNALETLHKDMKLIKGLGSILIFRNRQDDLYLAVDVVNEIFGSVIAGAVILCIIRVLLTSFSWVSSTRGQYENWLIWIGFRELYFMILIFGLAFIGEELSVEAEKTTRICYSLTQDGRQICILKDREDVNQHLYTMAQHTFLTKPRLSAGGFFPVNHSMIIFMFATVCTYLVALCQLVPSVTPYEE